MAYTYILKFESTYVFTHGKFGETFTNRINLAQNFTEQEAKDIKHKSKLDLNILKIKQ